MALRLFVWKGNNDLNTQSDNPLGLHLSVENDIATHHPGNPLGLHLNSWLFYMSALFQKMQS